MNEPQVVTESGARRRERLAGLFVMLAVLLLLAGFAYYLYHTAKRRGWYVPRAPYFTFAYSGEGLNIGDPVSLMGFNVGEITSITAQPPGQSNRVYIAFEVLRPYYGYIWSDSNVKIMAAGLLGARRLEITPGATGKATIYETNGRITEVLRHGERVPLAQARKGVFLKPLEDKSIADRADKLISQVETALPGILAITNRINTILDNTAQVTANAAQLTSNANLLAMSAQPVVSNMNVITTNLRDPHGSLGEWLIPTNLNARLDTTLGSANTTLTNANQQLTTLATSLEATLINLANITSNLNTQVQSNDQILSHVSRLVVDSDNLVQGLKKHWLLRGVFKKENTTTNTPAAKPPVK